jgi:hypothetical protein
MLFNRHASIISYHIDAPLFNPAGCEIPMTGGSDIRLFDGFEINKEFSISKFDLFSLQSDDPLEKHHPVSGKTDSHDIKPFRIGEKVSQFEAEVDPVIVIGGFHAGSLDQDRRANITEKEVSRKSDQANPDQKFWSQGRKEELADSFVHASIIKRQTSIGQTSRLLGDTSDLRFDQTCPRNKELHLRMTIRMT